MLRKVHDAPGMTEATHAIDRLRGIAMRLEAREDPDAEWFREALALYESGAPHGLGLAAAFGLRPAGPGATPWWELEARAARDALLRIVAARYFGGLSHRAQAAAIVHKVRAYEATSYRAHRKFRSAPPVIRGTHRELLFGLLKCGAPIGESTVRAALAKETTVFVSHRLQEDAPADQEETVA